MSQIKLNLQPPPNVDFVTGYPGIPPAPDRPQASVKGAIELRVPPAGVKAKWVRIELRKVETLPGGGPGNTYYDYVGPSPVNLCITSNEYELLRSRDFPFSIRIPESIPPTIALDNRASIGYELLASVCTKGKKGFLRKAKSVVVSVTSPVIIDKHELHSTWPVYCQPETRHLAQEGVNLIVERNRTCFGPGDRMSVVATVKSDSLHTVILRGFEILLKEATVFRPGIAPGRKAAPLIKQTTISDNKAAVNATLYGGTSHTLELACMVPANHTTPTLTSARHIDVTYTLCVKALMGTGTHLIMDLPIVMSNWQRDVSFEAISRIGPAPGLSLIPPGAPAAAPSRVDPGRGRPADVVAATLPTNRANLDSVYSARNNAPFSTLPASSAVTGGLADEFGAIRPTASQNSAVATTATTTTPSTSSPARRPGSSGGTNRFTITNAQPQEIPLNSRSNTGGSATGPRQWPTAEDEKIELYEKARQRVAGVQGVAASPPPANSIPAATPSIAATSASPPRGAVSPATAQSSSTPWLSAEEEKRRFQEAQAAVVRTQGVAGAPPPIAAPSHARQASGGQSASSKPSAAAELYAQAINARNRAAGGSSSAQAGGSSTPSPPKAAAAAPYLTAEQEKAALRRYEEAKLAVDRTQNAGYSPEGSSSGPVAYDSLFPTGASSSHPPSPPADSPPPFDTSVSGPNNIMAQLSEKERLRREYEARDNAAMGRQNQPPPAAAYTSPPPPAATTTPAQYANALEEKEALRRKFEARDAQLAARPAGTPQPPPPRVNSIDDARSSRPTPLPPASGSGSGRVLTAAEEKALLKAKYEAREGGSRKPTPQPPTTNGASTNGVSNGVSGLQPPPPLMPRPPADYIKETQDEDARLSRINGAFDDPTRPKLNGSSSSASLQHGSPSGAASTPPLPTSQ